MAWAVRMGALALAFAPLLAAALLVSAHAVDVPVADDWARATLFEREALAGFGSLPPLPRLVAGANARGWGGDLTLAMALGFGWVVLSALCVHGLLRRSFPDDPVSLYTTTFVANLLLFSPVQWEGFLWAARAWSFLPYAAVCTALFVLGARAPRAAKAGVVVLLAVASAASVSLPEAWGGGAGLAGLLALLGQPFARTPLVPMEDLAPVLGAGVVALFAVGAGVCLGNARLRARAAPWLGLGAFALGVGVLVVASAGPDGVLLSRHATPGLLLCLAALPLLGLGAAGLRSRAPALRPLLEWVPAFGAGILLVAIGLGWLAGFRGMQEWRSARLQARTSLVFLERFAPVHGARLGGDASLGALRVAARVLDQHGQLRPGLATDEGFGPFAPDGGLTETWGDIESVWVSGSGLDLGGFAWLPEGRRRADGVLVTARVADGPRRVVALAELEAMPLPPIPEHDHIYNHARIPGADELAPWRVRIPADALPGAGAVRIEAFAADSEALRLHRLPRVVELRRTPTGLNARLRKAGS